MLVNLSTWACDPCAIFNAARLDGHETNSWRLSFGEQYTNYKEGNAYSNNSFKNKENVQSISTSQFALSYDLTEKLGLQLTLPLITRNYEEISNYRSSEEWDAGLGDISLTTSYTPLHIKEIDWTWLTGLTAGIKLPTGDTGDLNDINNESEASIKNQFVKHHTITNVSDGSVLTYGSGSYDYILGFNNLLRYKNYLFLSYLQYTIRTEGDYDYEFDNDLVWAILPAYYFLLEHDYTIAGGLGISGENKGKDRQYGSTVAFSDISNIFVGPEVVLSYKGRYSAQLGVDFRVSNEDQDAEVITENRIRASLAYKF